MSDRNVLVGRESSVVVRDDERLSKDQRLTTHDQRLRTTLVRRVVIEHIRPEIDGGRLPIKRTIGERVEVTADVFADGHDVLTVVLRDRHLRSTAGHAENAEPTFHSFSAGSAVSAVDRDCGWRETPMTLAAPGTDRWIGGFKVDAIGWHQYEIFAWVDRFRSWRRDLEIKVAAGQDVSVELLEGSVLIREAAERAVRAAQRTVRLKADATYDRNETGVVSGFSRTVAGDAEWLLTQADALTESSSTEDRVATALGEELDSLMAMYADRSRATESEPRPAWVDRERARFSAWYEMFPRSEGPDPNRSGTFREAAARLPDIADLGFDVVYLPPIHPIGTSFRKGRNNSLVAAPGDPGSPWAIGSEAGGHTAIDPGLGSFDDFHSFREEAERLGLEVALDLAWQCSPDHPWVREHPEWFRHRPDGTIRYAENPPKKYQDIYPLDFECEDWQSLWLALLDVALFWIAHGVCIFRVDNPHTKTFGFWEWFIDQIHARHPDTIFLSEAFTRTTLMRHLAKVGFTQSYTYFTWRNSKAELTEYFTELTGTDVREYLRPNLFVNTPDILHAYLQHGGRPAFQARLLLAATLGANYGIYNGFELCEGRAVPGTEEYADSEKYQYRKWDWDRAGHIKELVARVNAVRRAHRALQFDGPLRFHATDNPEIIAYSKAPPDWRRSAGPEVSRPAIVTAGLSRPTAASGVSNALVLTVVNLDPHHMQHGYVQVPLDVVRSLGAGPDDSYIVRDLIDEASYQWRGEWNYVRFDPDVRQGHILRLGG